MIRLRQFILALVTVLAANVAVEAQQFGTVPIKQLGPVTNLEPPKLVAMSPVNYFRKLLAMTAAERNESLAGRTPASRSRILAKVGEYLALDADERELRLRATELRWYLVPLLRESLPDREVDVALVPEDLRELVKSRLTQWDALAPALQKEFLANEKTLQVFAQPSAVAPDSSSRSQEIADRFSQFIELTPAEKQQVLGTLSEAERAQMEKTLKTFDELPPHQRSQCVRNYAKFAGMSGPERVEFLKNAEHWSKMSPNERKTWRDLVAEVPLWPPTPAVMPPLPPAPPSSSAKTGKTSMATN